MVKITEDAFELMPPLLYPMVYDDVECPCVFKLDGQYFLIGSIREDVKVRYWFADDFFGEYRSFHEDVLLPQGNYAARTVEDGDHLLVYNFFYAYGKIDALRVLPPPKELALDQKGRLQLKSYYRWEIMVKKTITQPEFASVRNLFGNPTASLSTEPDKWTCSSRSGYELFCFQRPSTSFIWEGLLTVEGMGKLGLVSDVDHDGNGYYYSFDISNGVVKIRSWGFDPSNSKQNFIFNDIQSATFTTRKKRSFYFSLIRYGNYIELSIDGVVELTLMDYSYNGNGIGLYTASGIISLQQSVLKVLPNPVSEYASQEEAQKITE